MDGLGKYVNLTFCHTCTL